MNDRILTAPAVAFVEDLARRFRPRIDELLERRRTTPGALQRRRAPRLPCRDRIGPRAATGRSAPIPADLQDRRVEITGPVDRKMIINALNSGANVFMADFEDATSPTWANIVEGQANLMDAVRRTITYETEAGKRYALKPPLATLLVRPRGFHLPEKHFLVDGRPAPGMLFDFGMYLFHNAEALADAGTGPYFYLPKMQSHLEARLWNDIFVHAQQALKIPVGTIKVTVLIETLPAAFEMDEILYELRDHIVGLNCGRWDYIFSSIKTLQNDPVFVLPDRGQVTMEAPFLRAYTQLLIKTCHRRGAFAMGGMAAQIPIKDDPGRQRERDGQGARRQAPRSARRARRHVGRASGAGRDCQAGVRRGHARSRTSSTGCARTSSRTRSAARAAGRHAHRGGASAEHSRRHSVPRSLARRPGRGTDLQPDGRRRDRRDLAHADLAMDQARREAGRWPRR